MGTKVYKMKKLLFLLLLLTSTAQAQTQYCGADADSILVAKQTLSNLALQSETLDDVSYTKNNLTVTANSVVAPDGNTTADTITATAVNSNHCMYPTASMGTIVNGSTYRMSVYLKQGTYVNGQLYYQGTSNEGINANLTTCTLTQQTAGVVSASVTSAKNGFCLLSFNFVATNTVLFPSICLINSPTAGIAGNFPGTGTQNIYVWGLSTQLASAPADYIATTGSSATFGPTCPAGYSQSYRDPSRCYAVSTSNPLKLTPFTGSTSGTNINTSQAPLTPFRKP